MNHPALAKALLVAAMPLLFAREAIAQPAPPPFDMSGTRPDLSVSVPPISGIRLGQLKVAFEQVPLARLRALAGVGEIAHRGDAGESTYWLCYTVASLPTAQRVWFIAGELDGPDHFMSAIQATTLGNGEMATESCPLLPSRLRPIALSSGLWLGRSATSLRKALGKPSSSTSDALSYSYIGKVPVSYKGKTVLFDRTSFLHLVLRDGQLQGIVASQTTTN
ncbi:MAG: hypothetical protein KIS62_10890 [Ramlibacter sp.]|nr:hypothetical protein [Ramlibacter sp.]